jgi:hypothetical protein
VGGIVGHMLEHQRAANQMLQGLILPSPTEWQQGARRLYAAPLESGDLAGQAGSAAGALSKSEAAIHAIARRAEAANDVPSRASTYVQLVTTCAQCHGVHSKVWGPSGR